MCSRFSQTKGEVRRDSRFGTLQTKLTLRFNIAPTQAAPVALLRDGALTLQDMQWGFAGFNGQTVVNARSETAHEKRMFREAWAANHCLVPADGFYEWKTTPEGKQPYRFVQRSRDLFWFAGLWADNRFTILTAPALGCVRELHDRMPVILRDDAIDWWLAPAAPPSSVELIERASPAEALESYPVSRAMSNARHATADCIEPIHLPQAEFNL